MLLFLSKKIEYNNNSFFIMCDHLNFTLTLRFSLYFISLTNNCIVFTHRPHDYNKKNIKFDILELLKFKKNSTSHSLFIFLAFDVFLKKNSCKIEIVHLTKTNVGHSIHAPNVLFSHNHLCVFGEYVASLDWLCTKQIQIVVQCMQCSFL